MEGLDVFEMVDLPERIPVVAVHDPVRPATRRQSVRPSQRSHRGVDIAQPADGVAWRRGSRAGTDSGGGASARTTVGAATPAAPAVVSATTRSTCWPAIVRATRPDAANTACDRAPSAAISTPSG